MAKCEISSKNHKRIIFTCNLKISNVIFLCYFFVLNFKYKTSNYKRHNSHFNWNNLNSRGHLKSTPIYMWQSHCSLVSNRKVNWVRWIWNNFVFLGEIVYSSFVVVVVYHQFLFFWCELFIFGFSHFIFRIFDYFLFLVYIYNNLLFLFVVLFYLGYFIKKNYGPKDR